MYLSFNLLILSVDEMSCWPVFLVVDSKIGVQEVKIPIKKSLLTGYKYYLKSRKNSHLYQFAEISGSEKKMMREGVLHILYLTPSTLTYTHT